MNPDSAIELRELVQSVASKMIVGLARGTFGCSFAATLLFSLATFYSISSQPIEESGLKG